MKVRSVLGPSALTIMIVIGPPTAMAQAAGPGGCDFPPGSIISYVAKFPGPLAGPNSNTLATPPAPGQVVRDVCAPGNH